MHLGEVTPHPPAVRLASFHTFHSSHFSATMVLSPYIPYQLGATTSGKGGDPASQDNATHLDMPLHLGGVAPRPPAVCLAGFHTFHSSPLSATMVLSP